MKVTVRVKVTMKVSGRVKVKVDMRVKMREWRVRDRVNVTYSWWSPSFWYLSE